MSIRLATTQDIPAILDIYSPYVENTAISFEYATPSLEAFTARFLHHTAQFPWLVWEEDGRILGYAYACAPFERAAYQWCAEASIYLHPDAHRRGIGTKLYQVLEQILTKQGYITLYSLVTSQNTGSLAFHLARGYTVRAEFPRQGFKLGQAHGVTWLEKTLNFVEYPHKIPLSVRQIVKSDSILQDILDKITLS